jgi:iron complex transport system substrate-binding protein
LKTKFVLFIASLLIIFTLAGCAKPVTVAHSIEVSSGVPMMLGTPEPMVFIDGLSRVVTLKTIPQRIVSMAPSATELLYAVGAGGQMVGRDSFSNYPEQAKSLADVGGSMGTYSYELIASLAPDLVVAAEINTPEQVKALEDLGITVYYIANSTSLEGLYPILETMGKITGHEDVSSALVDSLKARVEGVVAKTTAVTTTPLVFYELDGSEPAKPWTAGPGTFIDQLITMAGGRNVGTVLKGSWAQISVEELLLQNPQIILLGDAAYGVTPDQVAARAGWEAIDAVRNGQVFAFNDDLTSRVGPRLVDALEALSQQIHPELYK